MRHFVCEEMIVTYSMRRFLPIPAAFLATAMAADLPIREVILFKHGVGYFERAGELKPGEAARLDFKASEMNDVLKSLTVDDRNGGKITGLRYDSSEPLDKKLADFPFQLGGQQPLSALLDQMKGARIEMKYGTESISGVIVSARFGKSEEKKPDIEQVVLLLDSGELRTFDLSAAGTLRFSDPALQTQLKDYLLAVNQSRSKDKRSVYIDSSGTKAQQLVASYMTPSAIWKSSYRLIFGEKDSTLEGWAIVDNTTTEDWTNIRLALVSGRPVSFISQLYEPRYRQRPIAELAEERSVAPVVYEGSVDAAGAANTPPPASAPAPMEMAANSLARRSAKMRSEAEKDMSMASTVMADTPRLQMQSSLGDTAQGRELGELFEYRFSSPVTVKKNESAMLPFLQQKLTTRKLMIFRDGNGQNPMDAAELTNSTGKTLDGGPITVYDANAYAGEALVETLKAGDKRLISYAVDLGMRVTTLFDSKNDLVREIHVQRGVLTTKAALQETKTYTIKNVDQKPKTLVIEHPQRTEYKLLNQKATETTASAYRFEVKVAPGATEKFPVEEERTYYTSTQLVSLTPDILGLYLQNKALSAAGKASLQQILDKKREIAINDAAISAIERDLTNTARDEERIRQNMESLNRVTGQQAQVQKYALALSAEEGKLAEQRDRQSELNRRRATLHGGLSSLIEKMEF